VEIGFGNCPLVISGGVPSSICDSCRRFWKQQWKRKNKSKHKDIKDVEAVAAKAVVEEDGVELVVAWEVEAGVMAEEVREVADVDEVVAEDLVDAETAGEDEVEVEVVAEEKEEESNMLHR
jgi:hypothetical protein